MKNICLLQNKSTFDRYGLLTVPNTVHSSGIRRTRRGVPRARFFVPNRSGILFAGSHTVRNNTIPIKQIQSLLGACQKQRHRRFTLFLGKTDKVLCPNIRIPKNVRKIYTTHFIYEHPVIKFFPLGRDFRNQGYYHHSKIDNKERDILCYCNFALRTHRDRQIIYQLIKNKRFMTFEKVGKYIDENVKRLSVPEFYDRLNRSKFVLCPRGYNLDTYRFYDSLHCGAIPIVVRLPFHRHFRNLPVLFLNSIADFASLTEEFLERKYQELSKKKKNYYKQLDLDFWMRKVCSGR